MTNFVHINPTDDAFWRAIILFGRNSATYKFALGKSLLAFAATGRTQVSLAELAAPFAKHVSGHLAESARQGTGAKSRFLEACKRFNQGTLDEAGLIDATERLGFKNVIDAFHVVGQERLGLRFFEDERRGRGGIVLTDTLLGLASSPERSDLEEEIEARWRLVETAWNLGVSSSLLDVALEEAGQFLSVLGGSQRRINVTSSRSALNGYQKGRCFYCFGAISIADRSPTLADVDHFYPLALLPDIRGNVKLDGVWNLVLSCKECNRGVAGKFDRVPALRYLERLARRNSYLIDSHHPLRETLMRQTGSTEEERQRFLQDIDRETVRAAAVIESARWKPVSEGVDYF